MLKLKQNYGFLKIRTQTSFLQGSLCCVVDIGTVVRPSLELVLLVVLSWYMGTEQVDCILCIPKNNG